MPAVDKLKPSDPRATLHKATINGKSYGYRLTTPPSGRAATGTVLLVHGFPDIGFGWRTQVPFLAEQLGLQVIVPDMLGYGQTDAPEAVEPYSHKSVCSDLVALVDHVGVVGGSEGDKDKRFFVGGHDWGGAVAWRMALWHADRLRGVFSVCTPYFPPSTKPFVPQATLVEMLPNFRYWLQFAGDELWKAVQGDAKTRQFLNTMYGGKVESADADADADSDGKPKPNFTTATGVDIARLDDVGPTPLLSTEELDYYTHEFARHGLHGPTNWYRTSQVNYDEERELVKGEDGAEKIALPSLMVMAESDQALPPALSAGMDKSFEHLTKHTVPGGHWVLWQSGDAVNGHIRDFLAPLLGSSKASI